jgi:hypothetical protein
MHPVAGKCALVNHSEDVLMPPAFLAKLPAPSLWTDADALRWANELRVSCIALAIALKEAKLIDNVVYDRISRLRVPHESKIDPELPESLNAMQRQRKAHLLELGLSDFYVGLCFEGFSAGVISIGRLAEALLCSHGELAELSNLYGRTLHGH